MTLKLLTPEQSSEFTMPVSVSAPGGSGHDKQTFTARFVELTQAELDALLDAPRADIALVNRVLIGWDDVTDSAGKALAFNETNRDLLTARPRVRTAVVTAYIGAVLGEARALGN